MAPTVMRPLRRLHEHHPHEEPAPSELEQEPKYRQAYEKPLAAQLVEGCAELAE